MAKLVILNQGMTGRTFELNVERNTVGRVEDNTFQIADASVSSHHAEILLRGAEILIRDVGSTNGTFINGEKITEAVLQPGQTLRFGQVELKIDDGAPLTAPAPAPKSAATPAPTPVSPKKTADGTMVIPRGVSLEQLDQGGSRPPGFETNPSFSKKSNKTNTLFIVIGVVAFLVIVALILFLFNQAGPAK